jgi:hypothetical protein
MDAQRGPRGCRVDLISIVRDAFVAQEPSGESAQRGRQAHISMQTRAAAGETTAMHPNEHGESPLSVNPN